MEGTPRGQGCRLDKRGVSTVAFSFQPIYGLRLGYRVHFVNRRYVLTGKAAQINS